MNIEIKKVKIIVTVPTENTKDIRNAVCNAGAGTLSGSNYTYCTTCVKSIGTFIPNENANPYLGEKNKLEIVQEDKLEVVCEIQKAKHVISELRKVHPYEEPAIDIVPLIDEDSLV